MTIKTTMGKKKVLKNRERFGYQTGHCTTLSSLTTIGKTKATIEIKIICDFKPFFIFNRIDIKERIAPMMATKGSSEK